MRKKRPFLFGIILLLVLIIAYAAIAGARGALLHKNVVAIIAIKEQIVNAAPTLRLLDRAAKDDSIRAVVIRIETPGGSVAATQEIYAALQNLKNQKPVVASLGSIATSGGYYVACGANKIIANAGTLTGSISAVMFFVNLKGLLDKIGVKGNVIKSGKYKDVGSPLRDMTKDEVSLLQGTIDDVSDQFVSAVAQSRNLSKKDVLAIADGRVFTGRQAKALGLVDEMGGIVESVKLAAKLANISGGPREIYLEEKKEGMLDYILGNIVSNFDAKTGHLIHPELYYY